MSKNFELLQQIGNEEELFRLSDPLRDEEENAESGVSAELEKEARERVLENSSLPNVFQTPNGSGIAIAEEISEPTPPGIERPKQAESKNGSSPKVFQASGNLSGPMGPGVSEHILELEKDVPLRVQQEISQPQIPRTSKRAPSSADPVSPAPRPESSKRGHQDELQKISRSVGWVDFIKEGARNWGRTRQTRKNYDGADREAIAREEEIKLVQRVFPGTDHHSPRFVLFAGLEKDADCASICARTARILAARAEGAVCVVDANFRSPSLHHHFGVENRNGLAEAVLGHGPTRDCAEKLPECDLWIMPSGCAAAKMNFPKDSDRMRSTLTELRDAFPYVVLHSSPFKLDAVSNFLSRWTDGVVLVVEANATRRDTVRRVKENLAAANVSVLGVVLNNRTFPIPEALYRRL
jgi:Mrp family chromosome partitioning ATPase